MKRKPDPTYQVKPWETHTMRLAFHNICGGEQPWVALGNFMNYWFCYAKDRRESLVSEPIEEAPDNEHCQKWAAYCAASVEYLCNKYNVPCPEWVHDPKYLLAEPWYHVPRLDLLHQVRDSLIASTPKEFSKRNIFSRDGMFDNKWELMERWQPKFDRVRQMGKEAQEIYRKTGKIPEPRDIVPN